MKRNLAATWPLANNFRQADKTASLGIDKNNIQREEFRLVQAGCCL
jgi:hypothetical protein